MIEKSHGILVLSVEVQVGVNQTALGQHRRLNQVAKRLLSLLDKRALPATWAVPQPASSSVVEDVVGSRVAQEIAILGDPSWVGQDVDHNITDHELDARILCARERSLCVSSLVLSGADLPRRISPLRQKGITAVCGPMSHRRQRRHLPVSKCDGVFYQTPAASVPMQANWFSLRSDTRRSRQVIRRLIVQGGLAVVAIRANHLIDRHDGGAGVLASFFDECQQGVESAKLKVLTLAEASSRYALATDPEPMRSILRPAA